MRILIIPDKFKGSLTASGVIDAIKKGILRVYPEARIKCVVASDGGDGFLSAVAANIDCDSISTPTVDALGRNIDAHYLYDANKNIAYLELAKTSGIELLSKIGKSAMNTSTLGTGIQLKYAIEKGARTVYIGLGGSATNDGGIGIARVFGYGFFGVSDKELDPIGANLGLIESIKVPVGGIFESISIIAVNDVDNPLFGKKGAAYTYARQKGATNMEIKALDEGLRNLDSVVKAQMNKDIAFVPGAGAAGGTGYGLKAFLNAKFVSGIEFVLDLAELDELMKQERFDYIITGEGKFDEQTMHGKLIKGIIDLGAKYSIPVIAVCGQSDIKEREAKVIGLHKILEIMEYEKPLEYNLKNAAGSIQGNISDFFMKLHEKKE